MKGKLHLALHLLLLLSCLSYARFSNSEAKASSSLPVHNLNTGLNYTTIQEAISAPETLDGHTIEVDAGTYYEHVDISKSISILGESRNTTIIDGSGWGPVVQLAASNLTVANFTIRNGGNAYSPMDTCIFGDYLSNILAENNTVMDTSCGVIFYGFSDSIMFGNLAEECTVMGLHLDTCTNCKMVNNTVINSFKGIVLEKSVGNSIQGNYLRNNNISIDFYASAGNLVEENELMSNSVGIVLYSCNGSNNFRNNNITSDAYNLMVWGSSLEDFMQNIDTSNIANDGTIYYITNCANLTLNPTSCPNIGYLALVNCTDVKVRDVDFSKDKDGLLMAESTDCSLINLTLANMRANLTLTESAGPSIHAIQGGLTLFQSDNNSMIDSRITNNSIGVCLYESSGNLFYHNSFIDIDEPVISNFQSPVSPPSGSYMINEWDNGFEGNYWSGYNGTDLYSGPYQNQTGSDGIGDTPYVIDASNNDSRPLMGAFSSFDTQLGNVCTVSNFTLSNFQFNGTAISFNASGENGTTGFCRIGIPTALINGTCRVFVNGTEVPYTLLPESDSTQNYRYFIYHHSTQEVTITPEFPPFLILPLFSITTLVLVLVYKKKARLREIFNLHGNGRHTAGSRMSEKKVVGRGVVIGLAQTYLNKNILTFKI
jgi:parallel beta-helix repeat protein